MARALLQSRDPASQRALLEARTIQRLAISIRWLPPLQAQASWTPACPGKTLLNPRLPPPVFGEKPALIRIPPSRPTAPHTRIYGSHRHRAQEHLLSLMRA